MKTNPKSHDSLFKWLIHTFTREFFEHYFPDIKIGKYTFIDKEFINPFYTLLFSNDAGAILSVN